MRAPLVMLAACLVAAGLSAPAQALALEIRIVDDGLTAELHFPGSDLDAILHPDGGGQPVEITLYQLGPGAWEQAGMGASLRVFRASLPEQDLYSQYFVSSASAPTTLVVPATVFAEPGFYDVFITFSSVGGSPVPTSHHNVVKNLLIQHGQFSLAEGLDYNLTTRLLVLP